MLKVSSISSRNSHHHSHSRLSSTMLVNATESGILAEAMENGIVDPSPPNSTPVTSSHNENKSHPTDGTFEVMEPPSKRIKTEPIERGVGGPDVSGGSMDTVPATSPGSGPTEEGVQSEPLQGKHCHNAVVAVKAENGESSVVTNSSNASHSSASNTSLHDSQARASMQGATSVPNPTVRPSSTQSLHGSSAGAAPATQPPLKATTMHHLRTKYLGELEYMLREFRKLERQLLGAKGAAQLEESAGSRERREKLHSFILHLEDTVRQIEVGCSIESGHVEPRGDEGAATDDTSGELGDETVKKNIAEASALSSLTKEKEETVQKLEEHILANLLPVKIRLKKQLAAQQGATRNPPGMPAPRRGSLQPSSATLGKGTFAAAAEERRKQAEAARAAEEERALRRASDPSQFGKPLAGAGSSLTQKLHGATLGSKQRIHGHGVGSSSIPAGSGDTPSPERKILYAGMVPQSTQHQSSLNAASGVHELVVEDPNFKESCPDTEETDVASRQSPPPSASLSATVDAGPHVKTNPKTADSKRKDPPSPIPALTAETDENPKKPHEDFALSDEERRKLRKKRRKRKLQRIAKRREKERQRQLALQQQAQATQGNAKAAAARKKSASGKPQGKKKGPKSVEYMCALCSEAYSSTCDYNPWWALAQHECPKCRKMQIPRIDISAPANAIEYHPALLAHADDNSGGGGGGGSGTAANIHVVHVAQPPPPIKDHLNLEAMDSDSDSDLSELSDGSISDESMESDDSSLDFQSMSQAEQAEHECFGDEYTGPVLSDDDASRLLVLMTHASTCPCQHKLTKHRDLCKSTKYMMLHVRDCPGTTSSFDVCPFPWCRKVKHLLYHLVSCVEPETCEICSPENLSESLKSLSGLNEYRLKKHRQRMVAAMKAANSSARPKGAAAGSSRAIAGKPSSRKAADIAKAAAAKAKSPAPVKAKATSTRPSPIKQPGAPRPKPAAIAARPVAAFPAAAAPPIPAVITARPAAGTSAGAITIAHPGAPQGGPAAAQASTPVVDAAHPAVPVPTISHPGASSLPRAGTSVVNGGHPGAPAPTAASAQPIAAAPTLSASIPPPSQGNGATAAAAKTPLDTESTQVLDTVSAENSASLAVDAAQATVTGVAEPPAWSTQAVAASVEPSPASVQEAAGIDEGVTTTAPAVDTTEQAMAGIVPVAVCKEETLDAMEVDELIPPTDPLTKAGEVPADETPYLQTGDEAMMGDLTENPAGKVEAADIATDAAIEAHITLIEQLSNEEEEKKDCAVDETPPVSAGSAVPPSTPATESTSVPVGVETAIKQETPAASSPSHFDVEAVLMATDDEPAVTNTDQANAVHGLEGSPQMQASSEVHITC